MTDTELLPLPGGSEFLYADNDMYAYARANVAERDAEIEALRTEAGRLARALESVIQAHTFARGRVERLEAALRPFAALYQPDAVCAHSDNQLGSRGVFGINAANITLGDLRRARATLADGAAAPA